MNLPDDFAAAMCRLIGNDEYTRLAAALDGEPEVSIRLNEAKCAAAQCPPDMSGAERVAWSSAGFYLTSRPRFTFDAMLHAGMYYVEEASSMFVEQAFRRACIERPARRVLDLCAAPGGKSTLIRSLMADGTLLVANEPIAKRAAVLAENMMKWGHPDVAVTNNYPEAFGWLYNYFDIIAADVPCSGEGMFRKDMQAREEWSAQTVTACAARQRQIIEDVWPALREGGYLIYSTCTFNREEDEDNVAWICSTLGADVVAVPTAEEWNIAGDTTGASAPVAHFFPHRTRGEGFFLALLRKHGAELTKPADISANAAFVQADATNVSADAASAPTDATRVSKNIAPASADDAAARKEIAAMFSAKLPAGIAAEVATYAARLRNADDFAIMRNGTSYYACRGTIAADVDILQKHLSVVYAGIPLAEEKEQKRSPKTSACAARSDAYSKKSAAYFGEADDSSAPSGKRPNKAAARATKPAAGVASLVPSQALALSTELRRGAFDEYDANYAEAVRYLRGETLIPDRPLPRGYVLVTYRGVPLGFANNVGSRLNNSYPAPWRIRSTYAPSTPPELR